MGKKLYVGRLPLSTTEDELRETFSAFGNVLWTTIIKRSTGQSRGFGFLEMGTEEEAAAAIAGLNGAEFGDRKIRVEEALPRGKRRE